MTSIPSTTPAAKPLPGRIGLSVWRRSLALQASWNAQRMQNLGLLVCLVPWLERQDYSLTDRRRFCRRHYEFFNTNPYLANFIIGGVLRLESEETDPAVAPGDLIRGFKNSLTRSFASLGDQLFWLGLRPALLLLACLLGWWGWSDLVLVLIGLFALGQLILRARALSLGYCLGLDIVDLLARPGWHRAISIAKIATQILLGAMMGCVLTALQDPAAPLTGLKAAGAMILGLSLPLLLRKRFPGEGLFLLAVPLALVLSYI